jgi:hypothetical protein
VRFVKVTNRIPQDGARRVASAERAVKVAAEKTVLQIRGSSAPHGYRIEHIIRAVKAGAVRQVRGRFRVAIFSYDRRFVFFDWGTRHRRRRALKRPSKTTSANPGVHAGLFTKRAVDNMRGRFGQIAVREWDR